MHKNPEIIDYINKNYKLLKSYGVKFFNNPQSAEDCIQRMYVKFLTNDYGKVINIKAFVKRALFSQFYNFKRMNKRYNTTTHIVGDNITTSIAKADTDDNLIKYDESLIDYTDTLELVAENQEYDRNLKTLKESIELLPKTQKAAILRRLNGTNPATNTEKANYRHGFLTLKQMMVTNEQ